MFQLSLHSEPLQQQWCDYYGHLNEAYYLVVFSNATFALQNFFDLGEDYFKTEGRSLYTAESHIRYLEEVRGDVTLDVESFVFGIDQKRIRVGHVLKVNGNEKATFECMLLHFDINETKVVPMSDSRINRIKEWEMKELPEWAGQKLRDIRQVSN